MGKSHLASRLTLLVAAFAALFLIFGVTTWYTIDQVRVQGKIYEQIVSGKDLIADILPPPEYILEAFLEVNLAIQDPASLTARRDHLRQLHKDYDERHAYWQKQDIDPAVRDKLTIGAHAPAAEFAPQSPAVGAGAQRLAAIVADQHRPDRHEHRGHIG